ncbi:MAG TPA: hypothetical protein VF590_26160 [Isosphaeraceae bacterium]|jgi:hypothetical protein
MERERPTSAPPASSTGGEAPPLDPERAAKLAAYLAEPRPLPPPGVDRQTGRAIPISDEERHRRYEDLKRRLAEIDAEDDEPHEATIEFMRNIDEERRLQGRPPAFEGYY